MFNHLRKYNAETALDLEARRQVLKALAKIVTLKTALGLS